MDQEEDKPQWWSVDIMINKRVVATTDIFVKNAKEAEDAAITLVTCKAQNAYKKESK